MADVFEYLDWRGDLSIEHNPLNEVDGMILARLSYAPFEYIINLVSEHITIGKAMQHLLLIPNIVTEI